MTAIDSPPDQPTDSCHVDRSCTDSGCGCATPATQDTATPTRRGLKAGLLAAACAVACLAVPLAVGGVAAVSGALAGEWWLLVGLTLAVAVIGTAEARRRRTGKVC
jgi:hypothetical protein